MAAECHQLTLDISISQHSLCLYHQLPHFVSASPFHKKQRQRKQVGTFKLAPDGKAQHKFTAFCSKRKLNTLDTLVHMYKSPCETISCKGHDVKNIKLQVLSTKNTDLLKNSWKLKWLPLKISSVQVQCPFWRVRSTSIAESIVTTVLRLHFDKLWPQRLSSLR